MSDAFYSRDIASPEEYYAQCVTGHGSLEERFRDIDDRANFGDYMRRLDDPLTCNFVLDFGNEDAFCATNLHQDEFKALLVKPVRSLDPCFCNIGRVLTIPAS